ncbi:uncharacterized protein LOC125033481 [Penaeus chinensis]|uniref:uncharacterized protein LOC125033481 n=1 Tax=Penaeus chinensis TaxID=139456 RepID=UPI001FB60F79|nr:uncharacterized protein LOC125033481 [Penaeus chinensis]
MKMLNMLENITKIISTWLLVCTAPLTFVFADHPCQVMSSPRHAPTALTVKTGSSSITLWVRGVGTHPRQDSDVVTFRISPNYCNETETMVRMSTDLQRWIPLCIPVQSKPGDSVNVSCSADIDTIWSTCKLSPYSPTDSCSSMSPCLTSDLPEGFNIYLLTFGGSLTLLLLVLIFSLYVCLVHLSNKLVQGDHRVTMSMFEPSRAMCSESESEPHNAQSVQPTPVNGLDSTLEKAEDVNETGDVYGNPGFTSLTLTRRKAAHDSENSLYEVETGDTDFTITSENSLYDATTKPLEYYQ